MRRIMLLTPVFAFVIGVYAQTEKQVQKNFAVQPGGLLTVEADRGSIEIKTGTDNTVDVDVTFRLRAGTDERLERLLAEYDLDIRQSGKDVIVTLDRKGSGGWGRAHDRLNVKFRIRVPSEYNVDLRTSGGGISVEDLRGFVDAKTSGGSLKFGNITGPVKGHTSGGSISVAGCQGNVDVRTSGGSLSLGKVEGTLNARTSGGSITVDEIAGDVDARTSGGSITVSLSKQPKTGCSLATSGGGITVHLAENIGVTVDARTSGGGVSTDFPVTVQGNISKNSLNAEINGGGPRLHLRTSGGSIRIRKM
ncbi:MAG TPA: hypothetical protein ENN17_02190 [bacterium]|nr:hypothetical protein [bacterium]